LTKRRMKSPWVGRFEHLEFPKLVVDSDVVEILIKRSHLLLEG